MCLNTCDRARTRSSEECYQIGVFCRQGWAVGVVAGAGVWFHGEVWFKGRGGAGEEREACRGVSGEQWCVVAPLVCPQSCEGL